MLPTFSQREGKVPVPSEFEPESLPDPFRAAAWDILVGLFRHSTTIRVFHSYFLSVWGKPYDEYLPDRMRAITKKIVMEGDYHEVLTLIETVLQWFGPKIDLTKRFRKIFDEHSVAYHIVGRGRNVVIVPRTSKEGGDAVAKSMRSLAKAGAVWTNRHIQSAAAHLKHKQYREAVRESITAVESMAKTIVKDSGGRASTLGEALKQLGKQNLLPNAEFKAGIEKLYAYTNSRGGVRHGRSNDDSEVTSEVTSDEAHFFFGLCVLLADYLRILNPARKD